MNMEIYQEMFKGDNVLLYQSIRASPVPYAPWSLYCRGGSYSQAPPEVAEGVEQQTQLAEIFTVLPSGCMFSSG